ncbi:MAG: glycosyltransferase family 4 protein [Desulfobacterales bacterium]|nr:glycosyltransferase family 4 protein [Desulfobacterales bacterium]
MRICFYAPFKPLGHVHPSGDLVIGTGLFEYLQNRGHQLMIASDCRVRWIYWTPWRWPELLREAFRAAGRVRQFTPDIWLTYHAYYKAPDLLGPPISKRQDIPYVIFQGAFSTKRRKKIKTLPGYLLNKKSLCAARHVFSNRRADLLNLGRLLPQEVISYVAPGIYPRAFSFDGNARSELRQQWKAGDDPVVLTAAMFRPGVKTEGLSWVIRACGKLFRQGTRFQLVIAGDGVEKEQLYRLASEHLPGKFSFLGKIPREHMYRFYSAGDIFVFPGIRESLGMVFLEAQSCGIPIIAFRNGGIPEVVRDRETGVLVPMYDFDQFAGAIEKLLTDKALRRQMGETARSYIRENHDLDTNYGKVAEVLEAIVRDCDRH